MRNIKQHLRDNRAEGYIWFIVIMLVFLVIMGAVFSVLNTTIVMKNIRTEVDAAAEDVYANIRQMSYGNLTAGATDNTIPSLTDNEICAMYCEKLCATMDYDGFQPTVSLTDNNGKLRYSLTNFSYTYIDRTEEANSGTFHTYLIGDLTHDGKVNDDDLQWYYDYLDNPDAVYLPEADLNHDGNIWADDVGIVDSLSRYWDKIDTPEHYQTSTALLLITFDLRVPISYGGIEFEDHVENCVYVTSLTVKPA